jgi:hypothetical protein
MRSQCHRNKAATGSNPPEQRQLQQCSSSCMAAGNITRRRRWFRHVTSQPHTVQQAAPIPGSPFADAHRTASTSLAHSHKCWLLLDSALLVGCPSVSTRWPALLLDARLHQRVLAVWNSSAVNGHHHWLGRVQCSACLKKSALLSREGPATLHDPLLYICQGLE